MKYDLYAELASLSACPVSGPLPSGLASGFVDGCTAWFAKGELERDQKAGTQMKNEARNCYMKCAQEEERFLPTELAPLLDPTPRVLQAGWLAIEVAFVLETPWYSKDDRPFHVLDNPVRKDRVFGVPFMGAASWKGLLRWAFAMTTGLIGPAPVKEEKKREQAEAAILHLFGNEKGASDDFQRGALAFYPTWFPRVGFEVINPHSRKTRAGTQPIYYEVVPGRRPKPNDPKQYEDGGKGTLRLLYAPWPGMNNLPKLSEWLPALLQSIEDLLTRYGISAKRTVGWGTAEIEEWRAWRKDTPADNPKQACDRASLERELLLNSGGGP